MPNENAPDLSSLSITELAALGSGADFWSTKGFGPVASFVMTDGPHGIRRQKGSTDNLGLAGSEPATCFPPAVGLGQSWDPALAERVGAALAREAKSLGVGVLLGPGVNIKRDPRCGRNFEYFSEDPLVAGAMGSAWVNGLQGGGVGASLKHFAANNQEHDRMRSSSDVDERTLREIYLRAFQRIVHEAQPWTIMCSYNRINGTYASENHWLLTEVLRDEWGFAGAVMSDWGAVNDRVAAVAAGLDLEMPGSGGATDAAVAAAVEAGSLDAEVVKTAAARIARLAAQVAASNATIPAGAIDIDAHHALAREAAGRGIVLLKNENDVLPLAPGTSIAVIGEFAVTPRYQGGGSSHVNATRVDVPLDEIRELAGSAPVSFSAGFRSDAGAASDPVLISEAVEAARAADVAVLFLGLAEHQESEGFDRDNIDLPFDQLELLAAVSEAQSQTVVVLAHGGVLALWPVADKASAILDGALLGQAACGGIADVLFGAVNPSGRLTETVPIRLQDAPAYLNFPGENSHVLYGEGIHVGYRWYDAKHLEVCYPFGHGLSYTTFDYSELRVAADSDGLVVQVTITNTGSLAGREVVQVYGSKRDSAVSRAPRELLGFASTQLESGASERVTVRVARSDLAYWDSRASAWLVEGGEYELAVGASPRDIRLTATIAVDGDSTTVPLSLDSTLGEVLANPAGAAVFAPVLAALAPGGVDDGSDAMGVDIIKLLASVPIKRMLSLSGGAMSEAQLEQMIAAANAASAA